MKLSILIPTLPARQKLFAELYGELIFQVREAQVWDKVDLFWDNSERMSIGEKRNLLLHKANGEYVTFIDDDDAIAEDYISRLLHGIETNPDCISLKGIMTTNGTNPEHFEHSIKYSAYRTTANEIKFERYPNHLNCIKASIAKQFKFPLINHGEDTDWATQIFNSGLLKKEFYTDKVLYYYQYKTMPNLTTYNSLTNMSI